MDEKQKKLIEELLGVPVYSRGNEILVDTADSTLQRTFTQLLQQLEDHVRLGQLPGPDLWVVFRRSLSDPPELKVFLSNASAETPQAIRGRSWFPEDKFCGNPRRHRRRRPRY